MGLPGLNLHPLAGDRKGTCAVSVSGNWRVTFKFVETLMRSTMRITTDGAADAYA
jgi:plasmid maintenance system killer protein